MLRVALLLPVVCAAMAAFTNLAQAQQIDVAAGFNSIDATEAAQANGITHLPQSLRGGGHPSASADYLFFRKHIGVEGEVAWRQTQATYLPNQINGSLPYRPFYADLNAIWTKKYTKRVGFEALGGAGALASRFQVEDCTASKCYATSTHFMGDVGAGIKVYVWRHFFVRPETRFYMVNNNTEFSSAYALRYGGSIGYSFRAH